MEQVKLIFSVLRFYVTLGICVTINYIAKDSCEDGDYGVNDSSQKVGFERILKSPNAGSLQH